MREDIARASRAAALPSHVSGAVKDRVPSPHAVKASSRKSRTKSQEARRRASIAGLPEFLQKIAMEAQASDAPNTTMSTLLHDWSREMVDEVDTARRQAVAKVLMEV